MTQQDEGDSEVHSSEIEELCLMKCVIFHFVLLYFSPNQCPGLCRNRLGHLKFHQAQTILFLKSEGRNIFLLLGGGGEELAQVEVEIIVDDVGFYSGTLLTIRPRQRAKTIVSQDFQKLQKLFRGKIVFYFELKQKIELRDKLSLLDNPPKYLVGCIIQKRYQLIVREKRRFSVVVCMQFYVIIRTIKQASSSFITQSSLLNSQHIRFILCSSNVHEHEPKLFGFMVQYIYI